MVHRAAARVEIKDAEGGLMNLGSKSEIARRAGVDKGKVELITSGQGHMVHPAVMRAVILACAQELGESFIEMMLNKAGQVVYCPVPEVQNVNSAHQVRKSNPLTWASRSLSQATAH